MTLIYAVLLLAILAIAYVLMKKRFPLDQKDEPLPYYAKAILSQSEQVLYHRLVAALPEHIVLAQVQLSPRPGRKEKLRFQCVEQSRQPNEV
ncbi:MAG: hypothetical protein K0S58_2530 [Nitrospira sp.]|nr:hypothetical protein [Nitrospira sp.]